MLKSFKSKHTLKRIAEYENRGKLDNRYLSLTFSWLLVDEAKSIDNAKLKDETLPANGVAVDSKS